MPQGSTVELRTFGVGHLLERPATKNDLALPMQ
jgi:hypothetical protein